MSFIQSKNFLRVATLSLLTTTSTYLFAADCKGLETSLCEQAQACYWVEGYQRANGSNVKAHCRARPNKSIKDIKEQAKSEAEDKSTTPKAETKTEIQG